MNRWQVLQGDCRELLQSLETASVDAVVTDPPYALGFMGKEWDTIGDTGRGARSRTERADEVTPKGEGHSTSAGPFLASGVDSLRSAGTPFQRWCESWAREVLRVLKPGGHVLAFGGTRTHHRLTCGLEDAGFEIRDCLQWIYGSGFPKSLDVSKAIDKSAGAEREVVGEWHMPGRGSRSQVQKYGLTNDSGDVTIPATPEPREWQGWGTALKPAYEIVVVAQKPDTARERDIITESLRQLEAQLWSLLPASVAVEHFQSSPSEYDAVCASARWTAGERSNTLGALSALTDTSQFVTVMGSCLSIVSSWRVIWDESCRDMSTSTIGTASSTTTASTTLKSLLLATTPLSIIQAATSADGWTFSASPVARLFDAVGARLSALRALSATESVIAEAHMRYRGGDALNLTPSYEPIVLARKPLVGTVAQNIQRDGTGALNIDGCRIGTDEIVTHGAALRGTMAFGDYAGITPTAHTGRWPANVILDDAAADTLDAQSGERPSGGPNGLRSTRRGLRGNPAPSLVVDGRAGDSGGASRFFYTAKASSAERGTFNTHPTVKPLSLMRWLVRLITPPGGVVLDPFAGSGTTLLAAMAEAFDCIGIEQDAEYADIIRRRLETAQMGFPLHTAQEHTA